MKILSNNPNSVYSRELYAWRKAHHICVKCSHESAIRRRTKCVTCTEKVSEEKQQRKKHSVQYHTEETYRNNTRTKRLYDLRSVFGVCIKCGRRDAAPGRVKCSCCLYKERVHDTMERREMGIYARDSYSNMCMTCNKNLPLPGKKICSVCYEKSLQNLNKANNAIDNSNHIWQFYSSADAARCRNRKKSNGGVSNEI